MNWVERTNLICKNIHKVEQMTLKACQQRLFRVKQELSIVETNLSRARDKKISIEFQRDVLVDEIQHLESKIRQYKRKTEE